MFVYDSGASRREKTWTRAHSSSPANAGDPVIPEASEMELRSRGVLDTPPSRGMTLLALFEN
jgi:hypothetical protein